MSRTDATRPLNVHEEDPNAVHVRRAKGGSDTILRSGANSEYGRGKSRRKNSASQRRQRDRKVCHDARTLINKEDLQIPVIRADRRFVGLSAKFITPPQGMLTAA